MLHGPPGACTIAEARTRERRLPSDTVADDVRVTLIDQNEGFTFGFSKLDVLFGRTDAAAVRPTIARSRSRE
jgi:hypothetical protein